LIIVWILPQNLQQLIIQYFEDFDETILDNEFEFKKRFREIERLSRPNFIIEKSLRETKDVSPNIDIDRIEDEES
jgi:hypothetical protein